MGVHGLSERGFGKSARLIIAASLGNALEFYEILVYGYFALTISKVFFPNNDPAVSLLVTLGTFGASFLARPVGAIFLGAYGDRVGRKRALTLSIALMTAGTAVMTLMPGFATIGILAPILVILARLLQGFSVGGEFASATSFLVEHRPDRAGFFASWQWASQGLAGVIATGFALLLTATLSADELQSWGWRIPFAFGMLVGPVGLYIRRHLAETPVFRGETAARTPVRDVVVGQWDRLLLAIGAIVISNSAQYMLVYLPTYAIRELGMPTKVSFLAAVLAAAVQTCLVPLVGMWSDKVGQSRIMIGAAALFVVTAYPAFYLLAAGRVMSVLILALVWITILKSFYSAALGAWLAGVFPSFTRVTGMALSYNIGATIFGGLAPFYAASLIQLSGDKLAPSYYLALTALLSLGCVIWARSRFKLA